VNNIQNLKIARRKERALWRKFKEGREGRKCVFLCSIGLSNLEKENCLCKNPYEENGN